MRTNKIYLAVFVIILLIFFSTDFLLAQRGPGYGRFQDQREKIEAHKIAFITEKVDLTPEEAEVFWPAYNANRDRMEAERKAFREKYRKERFYPDQLSDEEAVERLDAQLAHEQKMLNMRIAFNEELKEILPPQKILKLIEAEQEFKLELMRRVAGPNGPPGDRR